MSEFYYELVGNLGQVAESETVHADSIHDVCLHLEILHDVDSAIGRWKEKSINGITWIYTDVSNTSDSVKEIRFHQKPN